MRPVIEFSHTSEKDSVFHMTIRSLEFSGTIFALGILPESMEFSENAGLIKTDLTETFYSDFIHGRQGKILPFFPWAEISEF
jgi:hypothetical protein